MNKVLDIRKNGNKPGNLNALAQLLERVATLEAENVLLKTHVASLEQRYASIGLSHEAVDAIAEYTVGKIYLRLTPLELLKAKAAEQQPAAVAEETPEAQANEHQHDSNSEAGNELHRAARPGADR